MIWKKENSYTRKLRKNSELQVRIQLMTHNPPSSSLDALTTELLEALRRAGLKFTPMSHRGLYWGLARNRLSTSVQDEAWKWKKENAYTRKLRKENQTHNPPSSSSEALIIICYCRIYDEQGSERRLQAI